MTNYSNSSIPKLFEILDERKMSGSKLTEAIGIPSSTLSSWKKGDRKPKYEAVVAIADFLNVPVDYLMGTSSQEQELDLRIQAEVRQLSDQEKADVLKYIKFLQSSKPASTI